MHFKWRFNVFTIENFASIRLYQKVLEKGRGKILSVCVSFYSFWSLNYNDIKRSKLNPNLIWVKYSLIVWGGGVITSDQNVFFVFIMKALFCVKKSFLVTVPLNKTVAILLLFSVFGIENLDYPLCQTPEDCKLFVKELRIRIRDFSA